MKHRPLSVTLISYLFIAAGAMGIIYHASELKDVAIPEVSLVLFVRILAIIGGIFALRGANWARLLLVAWIIYHVILSFSHSADQLIMHFVLSIVVIISLFHPKANEYFKKK
jgi:4-hydroxybenzoate polyprenyltransferase